MKTAKTSNIVVNSIDWGNNPGNLSVTVERFENRQIVCIFTTGGKLNQQIDLRGEGAELELLIIYIGTGKEALTLSTRINHLVPNTRAKVMVKAVLFDQSRLDFRGNLWVAAESHGTDTYLKSESLLMSHEAISKTIPSLEIIANDVKAGHAATIGHLDEESLFYLESRGFDRKKAKLLLMDAFLGEAGNFFRDQNEQERLSMAEKLIQLLPKS